jgi:hypothetical protein
MNFSFELAVNVVPNEYDQVSQGGQERNRILRVPAMLDHGRRHVFLSLGVGNLRDHKQGAFGMCPDHGTRALHVAELTRDALRNMGCYIVHARVLLVGVSYRKDIGDTRYSSSELTLRKLTEMGGEVAVHDPYVEH